MLLFCEPKLIIAYCPLLNIKYTTLQIVMSNIKRKCKLKNANDIGPKVYAATDIK